MSATQTLTWAGRPVEFLGYAPILHHERRVYVALLASPAVVYSVLLDELMVERGA